MPRRRRQIGDVLDELVSTGEFSAPGPAVSDDIVRELQNSISDIRPPRVDTVSVRRVPAPAPQPSVVPGLMHPLDIPSDIPGPAASRYTPPPAYRGQDIWSLAPWLLGAGAVIAGLLMVSQYGVKVKGRVVEQGNAAIGHLMTARADLESFDFEGAKTSLERSAEEFGEASRELDALGPSLVKLISRIPGLSSLRTGQDILHAGKLLSDAGLALSEALDVTTQSGGLLDTGASDRNSLGSVFLPLQNALSRAQDDVTQASEILADLDVGDLPVEYREQFISLQSKLPTIRGLVDRAVTTTAFLGRMTGTDRPRRYLVLFSNPSELRPTGGFPGSYGLITFENGRVKDFRADDIYNPDGQIKDLIVPPRQLQHITPGWGMRDAAWWIDFPMSARKVMQYWQRGGGAAVDGVMTIKPSMLEGILKITGPISLPEYDTVLTAENVVSTLQLEVESKKTAQPKQIIVDLAPLILKRLSSAPASQWVTLLELFRDGLERRDVLMYFDDEQLQEYILEEGYSGAVRDTSGDYLMVDISNIKGAKADAVTDTVIKLESWMQDGTMVHRLTLTRRHNGGSTDYGFYNKPNYSWVRVLVPKGSVLRGISGNENPVYRPLIDYTKVDAERDPDLEALEATYRSDSRGVITYEESGKTGFGYWMTIEPDTTSVVQLEYSVPAKNVSSDYRLLVQRQPGLELTDFEFTIQKSAAVSVGESQPRMTEWPDSWRLHSKLEQDLELSARLK